MTTELTRKGLSAAKWGASSTLMRFILQIGAQAVLARLLGPEAYGVFGAGLIIMAMISLLTDVGFSWSLLRKTDLSALDIPFALTAQIFFGVLLAILLYAGSDFLALHLAGEPVGWVIRLLAFSAIFNAAASTPSILLSRDLHYRQLGLSQLISYVAGYFLTGIPMAMAGYETLSLVAAFLVQSLVRCGLVFRFSRLGWVPTFRHAGYRSFFSDGSLVFLTNMVNWLVYNLDRVTVSKLMSSQALGLYNVGANLAGTPNAILLGAIQPVFLSTGARLKSTSSLRAAYLGVMRAALLTAPAFYCALSLGAESLVHLLYGEKWTHAAEILGILFLGMPFFVVWSISTPILWNTGKAHEESIFQSPIVLFAALAYYFASPFGLKAVAFSADVVLFLRAGTMFMAASRKVALDWRDLRSVLWVSAAFVAAAIFSSFLAGQIFLPGIARLLTLALLTALCSVALLRFLPYRLSGDAIGTVAHVSGKVALWLQAGRQLHG